MKNFKDFISEDQLTLVDFYATWCGPCKAMHPILDEYKKQVGEEVRILKVDITIPVNDLLAGEYGISSVPTLMFFRNGELMWRGSGVDSASGLKSISDALS